MSDIADVTDIRLEAEFELTRKALAASPPEAEYAGYCLNCGEALPEPMRWCDTDCQHDWSRRKGALK